MILYPFANTQWWSLFIKNPIFIDAQSINYTKNQSYNKYSIINSNGLLDLSIPIENGRNQRLPFNEIKISYSEDWQKKHWRSLTAAYNNSPFFEYYAAYFEPLYNRKIEYLHEFNSMSFEILKKILKLKIDDAKTLKFIDIFNDGNNTSKYVYANKSIDINNSKPYYQVFSDKLGFIPNASIIDLIFNEGNQSPKILYS